MKIGLDLDGVLANFNLGFARVLSVLGAPTPMLDGREPEVWSWPTHYGASREQEREAWDRVTRNPLFWLALKPMPDAWPAFGLMRQMERHGDQFVFLTAREGRRVHQQTWDWVKDFTRLDYPTVIVTADKGPVAQAMGLDVLVEDKPENLDGLPWFTTGLLVSRAWNRQANGYQRVSSCAEALEICHEQRNA